MKKILLTLAFLVLGIFSLRAQITTFPYTENFDTFTNCGTFCGTTCNLPAASGWVNATGDDIDWTVENGSTGSGGTGPSTDQNTGTTAGRYLYTEASSGCNSRTAEVILPEFDFTSLTVAPTLEFWYHMWGDDMGTMDVEVSTNGGATWTSVVGPWTDNLNAWQFRSVDLTAYAGQASVFIRIVGITGSTALPGPNWESDMAIDNFTVYEPLDTDLELVSILGPANNTGGTLNGRIVEVEIANRGVLTQTAGTAVPVSYTIGGFTANETITLAADLVSGGSITYTFNTPIANQTPCTTSDLTATVSLAGDQAPVNDSETETDFTEPVIVSVFPYEENFDVDNGCWYAANNVNDAWEHGVPTGNWIDDAFSADNAWVTNLDGDWGANSQSFLFSPVFDLTGLSAAEVPAISFYQHREMPTFGDFGFVEFTIDGGQTWTVLGAFGDGFNWYNEDVPASFEGDLNDWEKSGIALPASAAGQQIQLRFVAETNTSTFDEGWGVDNFFATNIVDAAVVDITSPTGGSSLFTPQVVTAEIENLGGAPIVDPEITFTLTGPTGPQTVTEVATGLTIPAFQTVSYTFATSADLSFIGLYDVTATVNALNDANPANNSFTVQVEHNAVTVQSVCANRLPDMTFETGDEGWFAQALPDASTPAWLPGRGTPLAALPVPGPGEGNFSFLTDPAGANGGSSYGANSSDSWGGVIAVFSPVFDFSNLVPPLTLEFLMAVSSNSVDAAWLEYSIDGGNTWKWFGDANSNATVPGALNWYNETTYSPQFPSGPPSPTPGVWNNNNNVSPASDWLPRAHPYPADCFGQPDVRLRFMLSNTSAEPALAWGIDGISRPCVKPAMPLITLEADSVVKPEVDSVGIRVEWTDLAVLDSIDNEQNFYLQRTTGDPTVDNGNWDLIAVLPADSLVYFDRAVMGGVEYHYRVQALFANGLGEYSNTDFSSVPAIDPPAPYEPMLTGTPGHQSVDLEWPAPIPVHGIREFEIFFGVGIDYANVRIASVDEEVNAYTVIGLVNGFDYAFQYRPVYDDFTKGVMSNVVMLRPSIILNSDEALSQNDVKVFPNPNNGSFRLALSRQPQGEFTVRVLSVTGQELYREAFTGENGDFQTEIQLDNVSNGLYLLNVETENGTIQKKVSILR